MWMLPLKTVKQLPLKCSATDQSELLPSIILIFKSVYQNFLCPVVPTVNLFLKNFRQVEAKLESPESIKNQSTCAIKMLTRQMLTRQLLTLQFSMVLDYPTLAYPETFAHPDTCSPHNLIGDICSLKYDICSPHFSLCDICPPWY